VKIIDSFIVPYINRETVDIIYNKLKEHLGQEIIKEIVKNLEYEKAIWFIHDNVLVVSYE